MRNELRDIIQDSQAAKADALPTYYGYMGNPAGEVAVANQPGYVWVTLTDGMITKAYNSFMPEVLNMPVTIGYDPRQRNANLLRILDVRLIPRTYQNVEQYRTNAHHASHEWFNPDGGTDVVYVQLRQFMPLRPAPIGTYDYNTGVATYPFFVQIDRDFQYCGGAWRVVGGSAVDLSGYVPASGANLEKMVLISISGSTGGLQVTSGSAVAKGTITGSYVPIPTTPTGHSPICAVRLYSDQILIVENQIGTDIIDLRWDIFLQNSVSLIAHNNTSGLQGGGGNEYYHLTQAQYTALISGSINISGSSSYAATTPHNSATGLQGGSAGEYYHLTNAEHTIATTQADGSHPGYLSASDWTKFNNASGGSSSATPGHTIQTGGSSMPTRGNLNLIGFTVTDDPVNNATKVQMPTVVSTSGSVNDGDVVIYSGSSGNTIKSAGKIILRGLYSALPASGNSYTNIYKCTDGPYEFIWNGSSWDAYYMGYAVTIPPTSGWSWVNQGTAVMGTKTGRLRMYAPNTSLNWRLYVRNLPADTFTLITKSNAMLADANSSDIGIYLRESSSGKLVGFEMLAQSAVRNARVERMSNPTTDVSTPASAALAAYIPILSSGNPYLIHYKIQRTATNHIFSYSVDEGINWTDLLSESRTAYVNADQVGFGGAVANAGAFAHELVSWDVSA